MGWGRGGDCETVWWEGMGGFVVLGEGYALDQDGGVVTDNEDGDEADVLAVEVERVEEQQGGSDGGEDSKTGEMVGRIVRRERWRLKTGL